MTLINIMTPWSREIFVKLIVFSAAQEILRILWNPNIKYSFHNSPPPALLFRQVNLIYALKCIYLRLILILSNDLLHFILLYLIMRIMCRGGVLILAHGGKRHSYRVLVGKHGGE